MVTATSSPLGSSSRIGQTAILHIQPKSVEEMLQLLPGSLTQNPNLNNLGQANIREIAGTGANAIGTSVIVDGAPLSNDGNLQSLSPTATGTCSAVLTANSSQGSAGAGIDMRTLSPDNVEYIEVIRGIPSAEYGNLTSGVVIIKTKSGVTPWEVKFKTDPFSKMVYAGKGIGLANGGALNASVDWTKSYGDARIKYLGYDRITANLGYSTQFPLAGRQFTFNLKTAFHSNVNNQKRDRQMDELGNTIKNTNQGIRMLLEGIWRLDGAVLSNLEYTLTGSYIQQKDDFKMRVSNPAGVISVATDPGLNEGIFVNSAYTSHYVIDGKPVNLYGAVKGNKLISFGADSYNNIKAGIDWKYDGNAGKGLSFDPYQPPGTTSNQSLRPRAYKDIPAVNNMAFFIEDKLQSNLLGREFTVQAGLRITNMFVDKGLTLQDNIFMLEPRLNALFTFLDKKNNDLFDELSLAAGWGISYKAPSLLYLYPNSVYFDNSSFSRISDTDPTATLAVVTTDVLRNVANPDLKPTRSNKYEFSLNMRASGVTETVTYFNEKYSNEFTFTSVPHYAVYDQFEVPNGATDLQFADGKVHYKDNSGTLHIATATPDTIIYTYGRPDNNGLTRKKGVEFTLDLGQIKPIRTSVNISGAWFNIKRTSSERSYVSSVTTHYPYMRLMPGGSGTEYSMINTNFRFITHVPKLKLIFTTTVQVVWSETQQRFWKDSDGNDLFYTGDDSALKVNPLGFYNKKQEFIPWQEGFEGRDEYRLMVMSNTGKYYDKEKFSPWVMLNFRLTKEIGKMLDVSFTANNFTNSSRWDKLKASTGYRQAYPNIYFGAELRLRINN